MENWENSSGHCGISPSNRDLSGNAAGFFYGREPWIDVIFVLKAPASKDKPPFL
jgi:hypothetical protein